MTGLLTSLSSIGLHGREVTECVVGEPDIRVQVRHERWPVTVELLCGCPTAPPPPTVDAVRVWKDERAVWRHPLGTWVEADLVRFLTDLVVLPPSLLSRRYLLLG